MLRWLLKKFMLEPPAPVQFGVHDHMHSQNDHSLGAPMQQLPREGIPVDPASVPTEVHRMMGIIHYHEHHPLVRLHFHQITIIGLGVPGGATTDMYLPEFRDGDFAALLWDDADGTWGSGGWIRLAHRGADITCPPTEFGNDYLVNTPGFPDLSSLLDGLYNCRPSANVT